MKKISSIDLFAGVGGMRISLQRALNRLRYKDECKLYSEINIYSRQTYNMNFPKTPLIEDISQQVIATRLPILTQWISSVMVHIGESIEHNDHGQSVRSHVQKSVGKAVRSNSQVSTLKLVPVLGRSIESTLEQSVTDIVTQSIINLLKDITPQKIDDFVEHGLGRFSSEDHVLDQEVLLIVNECLELVKVHVAQQRWKDSFDDKPTTADDII